VHRPLCEQGQDGGADVAAPAALVAATAGARAGPEAARSEATPETGTEPGPEGWPEGTAAAGVVAAQVVAEFSTGLAAVFVQRAPLLRGEAEAGVSAALIRMASRRGCKRSSKWTPERGE
jgi:hypothetical protein